MSTEVKRYDPINSDGTCGICVEEPDYGAYVEFADYDALHAEAEALRDQNRDLRLEADGWFSRVNGVEAELEALRAENERLSRCLATANDQAERFEREWYLRGDELETLRAENAKLRTAQAEQGERQEAACWVPRACLDKLRNGRNNSPTVLTDGPAEFNDTPLYTTPQPGPDVRALVSFALELIDGAWKGGSFDGGDIQEAGVRHGLLVVEQREESCGEHCDCVEYGFPAECYRLTPGMAAHRQAQQELINASQ